MILGRASHWEFARGIHTQQNWISSLRITVSAFSILKRFSDS